MYIYIDEYFADKSVYKTIVTINKCSLYTIAYYTLLYNKCSLYHIITPPLG